MLDGIIAFHLVSKLTWEISLNLSRMMYLVIDSATNWDQLIRTFIQGLQLELLRLGTLTMYDHFHMLNQAVFGTSLLLPYTS